jgi:nicotinate-nucleotide--dimethylbenzimidazole phosphoribosyltransferase
MPPSLLGGYSLMRRYILTKGELLNRTIRKIGTLDERAMSEARTRQNDLTKPAGSLGQLEDISIQIAGIQGKARPGIKHKAVIVMAADHGVVAEGVSAYPQEVTPQMVQNFLNGGAAINVISKQVGARIQIVDMGVAAEMLPHRDLLVRKVRNGTADMAKGPAMTVEEATAALETGIDIVNAQAKLGLDIVGTGDMGIGNTTPSAAICAVMTGKSPAHVTGRGTGIDDTQLKHKTLVIEKAIEVNRPDPQKPLEVLAKVGGLEIGGLAGVMLGAGALRIPVVIDGFISGAAALIASGLAPNLRNFMIAGHMSVEPGHQVMLNHLGLKPLINLGLRLGEGTGAALGIFLCETSTRILSEMATFSEAGVSEKS